MAKKWLFWFCEGSVCVSGQNQMCRLCGCLKLFLKNAGRQKKIKKHWGGLSVGLLAVPFQYGLYVFGHLSKWFVFVLMFKFWSVYRLRNGRPTIGYNVFRLHVVGVLEHSTVYTDKRLFKDTKLFITSNAPITCRWCYSVVGAHPA